MAKKVLPKKWHEAFKQMNLNGDIEGLKLLLESNNIDINATFWKPHHGTGFYLFHDIFYGKNMVEKLEYFYSKGADLTLTGYAGKTVLFEMKREESYSHLPVLQKLLDLGIDVNRRDNDGSTFITHLTREYGDKLHKDENGSIIIKRTADNFERIYRFIELLIKYGADPFIKNNYDTSAMDWVNHRKETNEFEETDEKLERLFLKGNESLQYSS